MVDNKDTYEELIGQFTPLKHIIKSKYILSSLGNCNPKRQITIEKFMMRFVMEILLKYMDTKHILTYMSDKEIVFEYFDGVDLGSIYKELDQLQKKGCLLHCEDYVLYIK